jgi:hypothetical protein
MKRFFKWLFWLVVAAAVVVGTWFAFDGRTNDVVEAPAVETVDTTAVNTEVNLEVVDTLNTINTTETNE